TRTKEIVFKIANKIESNSLETFQLLY
ncbi:MAG: hypothetical protein K0S80_5196, partial [Neobacillus sp.]|nr:hypothetical protein [Neobacillus sp.]